MVQSHLRRRSAGVGGDTCSSLTGVTKMLNWHWCLSLPVIDGESKTVAGRLAAVMRVGQQASVDVGLREAVRGRAGKFHSAAVGPFVMV